MGEVKRCLMLREERGCYNNRKKKKKVSVGLVAGSPVSYSGSTRFESGQDNYN
jgi:hypothetical protein